MLNNKTRYLKNTLENISYLLYFNFFYQCNAPHNNHNFLHIPTTYKNREKSYMGM